MPDQPEAVPPIVIRGSSFRPFLIAFLFIFLLGGAVGFGSLEWVGSPFLHGWYALVLVAVYCSLCVVLARSASFQVAGEVVLSEEGIRASWRGPFGGRASQQLAWVELQKVRVNPFGRIDGTCSIRARIPMNSIYVTFPQARAILRHPRCPITNLSPRIASRIGLRDSV